MNREEKFIKKFIHKIERKAEAAKKHLSSTEKDREEIIKKRNQLHSETDAKNKHKINVEISEAIKRFEESAVLYEENIGIISRTIENINSISGFITHRNKVMTHALHAAGKFYGDSIPGFPEHPDDTCLRQSLTS